jgi:hypothetical protein
MHKVMQDSAWTRSTYCAAGNCVEVAPMDGGDSIGVRDSKNSDHVLIFTPSEWNDFLDGVQRGEFGR